MQIDQDSWDHSLMELRGPQPVDGEREREVGEREGEREREIRRGIGLRGGSTHPIKLPNPDHFFNTQLLTGLLRYMEYL